MQDTECKLSLIIGDVIDNFTNIEIKIKNIIWYGFSMIPYKNDVVHLKFVAIDKSISNSWLLQLWGCFCP